MQIPSRWKSKYILNYFRNYCGTYRDIELSWWVDIVGASMNAALIKGFVTSGQDVNAPGKFRNLLTGAFDMKKLHLFYYLLDAGVRPLFRTGYQDGTPGYYPLLVAALYENSTTLVKLVVDVIETAGGTIDWTGHDGYRALPAAVFGGVESTRFVLEQGIDILGGVDFGFDLDWELRQAVESRDVLKLIMDAVVKATGGNIGSYASNALRAACEDGNEEAAFLYMDYGVDIHQEHDDRPSAFTVAVLRNQRAIVGRMLARDPLLWSSPHLQVAFDTLVRVRYHGANEYRWHPFGPDF